MNRRYQTFKSELKRLDIKGEYLYQTFGITKSTFNSRMSGATQWTIDEIYRFIKGLNWPLEKWYELFPPEDSISGYNIPDKRTQMLDSLTNLFAMTAQTVAEIKQEVSA